MKVTTTELPGVLIIEPKIFRDERGFFLETYNQQKYSACGVKETFIQDNHSSSKKGTLRGLHAQRTQMQGKLVRVIEGEIFDVAVDARRTSPTFRRWVAVRLSAANFKQFYVPPGYHHGFCVLSDTAQVEYKCTAPYAPEDEIGIIWNDPELTIDWPITQPILSPRDARLPPLSELDW
jgi:dTDP-4-dehydrorhamnose 3,5-epimerase